MLRQRAYPGAGANVDQFCKTVEGFPRNYLVIDTVGTNPLQAEERLALHWIVQTIDLQHILVFPAVPVRARRQRSAPQS